jgi:hypothetical protein
MENLLAMFESSPIWIKIFIPFVGAILYFLIYDIVKNGIKSVTFFEDVKIAVKMVFLGMLMYAAIIVIIGLAQLILSMFDLHIWQFAMNHKWIIFYILLIILLVYAKFSDGEKQIKIISGKGSKSSSYKRIPSKTNSTINKKVTPIVVPVKKTALKNESVSFSMTDVESQLRKGIDVKIDFDKSYSKINESLKIINNSRAKITFFNVNPKQSAILENMKRIAMQAPGLIIFDAVIDAGFEAESLASSGACFTCDCSNRSSTIPEIAKAAKESGGYVMFVNYKGLDSSTIKKVREFGGYSIEFQ